MLMRSRTTIAKLAEHFDVLYIFERHDLKDSFLFDFHCGFILPQHRANNLPIRTPRSKTKQSNDPSAPQ
jgi:hypothetical protein